MDKGINRNRRRKPVKIVDKLKWQAFLALPHKKKFGALIAAVAGFGFFSEEFMAVLNQIKMLLTFLL